MSNLSPYPVKLIPFRPLDCADNQFGQLYRKFKKRPYKEARIKGFTPPTPFVAPSLFFTTDDSHCFTWPTLAELNNAILSDFGPDENEEMDMGDLVICVPVSTPDPHHWHLYAPSQRSLW